MTRPSSTWWPASSSCASRSSWIAWHGLHHAEGIEFEQYDTFDTVYVIAHRDGRAIGGARLKRTDCSFGGGKVVYSYMIRDAHRGLLPGMPTNLCRDEPRRPAGVGTDALCRPARTGPGRGDPRRQTNTCTTSAPPTACSWGRPRSCAWRRGWLDAPSDGRSGVQRRRQVPGLACAVRQPQMAA
ncbi:hypothetical protein FLP41_01715 (plasmid) [Paracoccus marcusii]|uniref:hypothetical protein n=1 Tax=Paracoccus marcusii TaxID=59779 RepID=UPI002ED1A5A5|nr:hypothetical protein FLP41_01715 [Paracoccus marcusii]